LHAGYDHTHGETRDSWKVAMEPIPETIRAIEELGPFAAEGDLLDQLQAMGDRVRAAVPDCVGLSLTSAEHGVTFTLVASDQDVALLDAVQSVTGAPDAGAIEDGGVVELTRDDGLDEAEWRSTARATAAPGVASTLTLPIVVDERVSATVNLYGASPRAFDGLHEELADILGAWAPGAVTNADLPFVSRREAERAPGHLGHLSLLDRAAALVSAARCIDPDTAGRRVEEAAARAGISTLQLAEALLSLYRD
jgi:GAF domain-containing protein